MHWRRKWQPTPVFLPRESHGQRNLAGCSPWGCKSQTHLATKTTKPPRAILRLLLKTTRYCLFILYSIYNVHILILYIQIFLFGVPCENPAATTAAKSLKSCPTLCDPIDGSPPGSPVPGILQARTLEWVAISFSNA